MYPMFYYQQVWTANGQSNLLKPNFCTNVELQGYETDLITEDSCSLISETGLPDENCIFVATGPSDISSSVMALPYLPNNTHFCDMTENFIHDPFLPTKHNAMCKGKSVFDVILQHPDFENYSQKPSIEDPTPHFTIIQPNSFQPIVMVLDFSGS